MDTGLFLFSKVAKECGLDEATKNRCIIYLYSRWPDLTDESYIKEWCMRFKYGNEYNSSDSEGLAVLNVIDSKV